MVASITNISDFRIPGEELETPDQFDLRKLAVLIEKYAPHDGQFDFVDGLRVVKESKPTEGMTYTMARPGICIVAQGAKSVTIAQNVYDYDESRLVVYAAEVPVNARITSASKEEPFLCLVVHIDPHKLTDLILKVFPNGVPKTSASKPIYVGKSNSKIIKCAIRMMDIIQQQEEADLLVPLSIEEILIRLLRSPAGPCIAQIGIPDSHAQKIAKAITWLKENFTEPMKVNELAHIAGMSPSSFHSHFKSITSMSPLQFQKTLRLEEARNLMTTKMLDVSNAGYKVGYSSISQFSREYKNLFGMPPAKYIASLREN